jgi:hypothetical protein
VAPHVARVNGVPEEPRHVRLRPTPCLPDSAVRGDMPLRGAVRLVQEPGHRQRRSLLAIEGEDLADQNRLEVVHDEPLALDAVAEGHSPARPLSPASLGRDFVSGSLADHFPLELGEGHQHVQRQPSHRVGGREVLGYGHEGSSCRSEPLHQLGEVEERAAQAVDLVDDHDVDLPDLDVGEESLEGRPLDVCAGEIAVVVAVVDESPARLPLDVGGAGLPLGVERVEVLLEADRSRSYGRRAWPSEMRPVSSPGCSSPGLRAVRAPKEE